MEREKKHEITLENRRVMSVTAVDEVLSFDDTVVNLSVGNSTLTVSGNGLTITNLSVENGNLNITGNIEAVMYTDEMPKKRFMSRFFN